MTECDVYADELRLLNRGYPLYEPDPSNYDRVRIGDVGFIHRLGYYERVFNPFYSAEHPINARFPIPEGTTVLDDKYQNSRSLAGYREGSQITSEHVQSIEISASIDVQALSPVLPPGASVKFRSSKRRAAALFLPSGADCKVAVYADGYLKDHAKRHCRSWADHIKAMGLVGDRQTFFFVTGHDLTDRWATAVLRNSERESEGRIGVSTPWMGGSLALRTSSVEEFNVPLRIGPQSYSQADSDRDRDDSFAPSDSLMEVERRVRGPRWNQCVFLRGFWIVEREFRPFKLKAAAQPEDLDKDRDGEANGKAASYGTASDTGSEDDTGINDKWVKLASNILFHATDADMCIINESEVCIVAKCFSESKSFEEILVDSTLKVTMEKDPVHNLSVAGFEPSSSTLTGNHASNAAVESRDAGQTSRDDGHKVASNFPLAALVDTPRTTANIGDAAGLSLTFASREREAGSGSYPITPYTTFRQRITVVCSECKRLKLKCDRRSPCGSCQKRDTVHRCIYSQAAFEKVDIQSINNRLMEVEAKLRAMENGADARKASNVTEPWERKLPYEALLTRQEGASQSSFLLSTVRWRDDAKVSDFLRQVSKEEEEMPDLEGSTVVGSTGISPAPAPGLRTPYDEFPRHDLHSAAASGNLSLVEYALKCGQPVDLALNGVLPLHAACAGGSEAVVKYLIDQGADVNAPRFPGQFSTEMRKSSVLAIAASGSTPLHYAAANGHEAVVRLLLACGAVSGVTDKHGESPEMLARENGWVECADTLAKSESRQMQDSDHPTRKRSRVESETA